MLRRLLADTGTLIWECADGSEALAAYEEHRPDIVLMDIRMPHYRWLDGHEADSRVRSVSPHHCLDGLPG